jgi:hypothetical protein
MSRNRGIPKPKLADLSRTPPTLKERQAMRESIFKADPVATAILGGVMVEHELEVLLRRRFLRNDDKVWKELIGDHGPMSSFSAKILMGYAFRIYDDDTKYNLNIVRKIRNAFAHSKKIIHFDHDLISEELLRTKIPKKRYRKDYLKVKQRAQVAQGEKLAYVLLCFALSWQLVNKQISAMQQSTYRARQKFAKQNPYATGLLNLLAPQPQRSGVLPPLSSPGRQTSGPTQEARLGLLSELFPPPPKNGGNKDK